MKHRLQVNVRGELIREQVNHERVVGSIGVVLVPSVQQFCHWTNASISITPVLGIYKMGSVLVGYSHCV
jgi:hypothetical protein